MSTFKDILEQIREQEKINVPDSIKFNKEKDKYTWWSYRANSRANNKGWRIDYALVSENIESMLSDAFILPDAHHSDHCPVGIKVDF